MARSVGIRMGTIALSLCVVAAQSAAAYEYPLGDYSVREAYFFGRSTDGVKVARFLGQYFRRFQPPVKGPYVAQIEFRTPYEQVVLRSWQNSIGYSAQQAQKDYAAQPDLVLVHVFVYLWPPLASITPPSSGKSQSAERPEDFWRKFEFRVVQEHSIEPKKVSGKPLYGRRGGLLGGAEVLLEFDAAHFVPRTTRVEVTTPEGQTVVAEFGLDELK